MILSGEDNQKACEILERMRRSFGYVATDDAIKHFRKIMRMITHD